LERAINKTAEKEVQETSCRGSGGIPQIKKVPQDWGIRGLIENISAVFKYTMRRNKVPWGYRTLEGYRR